MITITLKRAVIATGPTGRIHLLAGTRLEWTDALSVAPTGALLRSVVLNGETYSVDEGQLSTAFSGSV